MAGYFLYFRDRCDSATVNNGGKTDIIEKMLQDKVIRSQDHLLQLYIVGVLPCLCAINFNVFCYFVLLINYCLNITLCNMALIALMALVPLMAQVQCSECQ